MAIVGVNQVIDDRPPKKSSLETFATAMGILSQLGSLGMQAYGTFNPQPSQADALAKALAGGQGAAGAAPPPLADTMDFLGHQNMAVQPPKLQAPQFKVPEVPKIGFEYGG